MWGFILAIIIGGVAGFIAEKIMNADHGMLTNIVLGVAGAFILNLILSFFITPAGGGIIWQLIAGIVGACALIWGYRAIKSRA